MKTNLTLQEKLRDLRDERKLKPQDVADDTGISCSEMQYIFQRGKDGYKGEYRFEIKTEVFALC